MQKEEIGVDIISISVEQQRLDRERHSEIINDFAMKLLHQTTIDDIVWLVAKSVIAKMGFLDCVVYLIDSSGKQLIQKAAHGFKNPIEQEILNPIIIPIGKGIVGSVAQTCIPEIVDDTSLDDRYIIDDASRLSEIAVPIVYENKLLGVIDSEHPRRFAFSQKDLITLTTIAAMASIKMVHAQTLNDLLLHKANLELEIQDRVQQLVKTNANLEKSNQDLQSFAYAASHDMQEPLRTIISYLQLLRRKEINLSESSNEYLDFAVDGSKRMKELLDGLLKYSLVKNSSQTFQPVDLNDIMMLVMASLNRIMTEQKTEVNYDELPKVLGNRTQLVQVFQNLVSNAIKFQKPNHPAKIDILWKELDQFYQITVKDNGIGIAKEYHQKIFGLFKRLNTNKYYKGSGIGLSLCRRIIEQHQGTIAVVSVEGEGTDITFTLPKVD